MLIKQINAYIYKLNPPRNWTLASVHYLLNTKQFETSLLEHLAA